MAGRVSRTALIAALLAAFASCSRNAEPAAAADDAPAVEARRAFAVSPASVEAACGFTFAPDGVGELLREQLTPPRTLAPEPPAFVAGPVSWRAARLAHVSPRLPFETALETTPRARVLPQERASTQAPRTAFDVPPLAAEASPTPPSLITLPVAPLAFAAGPDPGRTPLLELAVSPPARLAAGDDPTAESSRQAALTLIELLRIQPAPFLRLMVPDPFEAQRAFPLRAPLTDDEAPVMSTARPALPALPAK